MPDRLAALKSSTSRLRHRVEGLSPGEITEPSYASEWTVADVLSHLGSGAVIFGIALDAGLAGAEIPDDSAPQVWAEWNAKSPAEKAADGLAADRTFVERLEALTAGERDRFHVDFGPLALDFDRMVQMRLAEHAVHTWDVEVAFDPAATIPADAAEFVLDNLAMITGYVGRPTGVVHDVRLRTTDPAREFTLAIGAEQVALEDGSGGREADLELPADALIRLVYGRLDPKHTPTVRGAADLDELRRVFPGV